MPGDASRRLRYDMTKDAARPDKRIRASIGSRPQRDPKTRITNATIRLIAEKGSASLSHRDVAAAAGVSLAATTYHFQSKEQIIQAASCNLLADCLLAIEREVGRSTIEKGGTPCFATFVRRLLYRAAGRQHQATIAWCEIILDAARSSGGAIHARPWWSSVTQKWLTVAQASGLPDPQRQYLVAFDRAIGLSLMIAALGLNDRALKRAFEQNEDPRTAWAPADPASLMPTVRQATGRKAADTQARIIDAAVSLLMQFGAGAITHRAVAEAAQMTLTAPTYHFGSIESLLATAQRSLFERSKDRYRAMSGEAGRPDDIAGLVDLTATIFIREVTEFGPLNLSNFSVWLAAARHDGLKQTVWAAILDQAEGWRRQFDRLGIVHRPIDPFLIQCSFVGRMVRLLSSDATIAEIALSRSLFALDLALIQPE